SVLDFLDKSRSALSKTHTTSQKPAPSLTPATIEASSLSGLLIDLVHADENDPNFLQVAVKNEAERKEKAAGFLGKVFIAGRAKAMDEYLAQDDLIPKIRAILEEKKKNAAVLNAVYAGTASQAEKDAFFAKSKEAWEVAVPKAIATIEEKMIGPYMLGDQLSLADIHVGVWFTKVVALAAGEDGADSTKWPDLLSTLSGPIGADFKVGPKLTAFWNEIIARDGFKKFLGTPPEMTGYLCWRTPLDATSSPPLRSSLSLCQADSHLNMDKFHIHPVSAPETSDEPVDFILAMLASLLVTAAAFPLGIAAALLHVLGTVLRNIPTCVMLAVGCIVLTSAVLLASVAYAVFWLGAVVVQVVLGCKRAIKDFATFGTGVASLFADEFAREKRKQLYERWGIRT
ncbi:hypothetical protein FRC06_011476, partial [Ceratobasidium sp. 370]